jgi:hypothetical protein
MKAFQGAEAVFALTNFYDPKNIQNPLDEARQGCAMADIAKEMDVKVVLWSTVPSALVRTGAKFDSPRLVENKFTVSQYLKYREIPHIDVYLGFFMDNWINFRSICKAEDGAIEVHQPLLKRRRSWEWFGLSVTSDVRSLRSWRTIGINRRC